MNLKIKFKNRVNQILDKLPSQEQLNYGSLSSPLSRRRFLATGVAATVSGMAASSFNLGKEIGQATFNRNPLAEALIQANSDIDENVLIKIADDHKDIDDEIGVAVATLSAGIAYYLFSSDYFKDAIADNEYQMYAVPAMGNSLFLGHLPWEIGDTFQKDSIEMEEHLWAEHGLDVGQAYRVRVSIENYMASKYNALYFYIPTIVTALVTQRAENEMRDYASEKRIENGPWAP